MFKRNKKKTEPIKKGPKLRKKVSELKNKNQRKMEKTILKSETQKWPRPLNSDDAIFVHDMEGNFIEVNKLAYESLGYTRVELLKRRVSDIEENFDKEALRNLWKQMVSKSPVILNSVHKRKDGVTFPVEIRIGLIQREGKPVILALVQKLSEQRKIEGEIRRRFAIEKAVADISRLFINPGEVNFNYVLRVLGEVVASNRSYIFQFRDSCRKVDNT